MQLISLLEVAVQSIDSQNEALICVHVNDFSLAIDFLSVQHLFLYSLTLLLPPSHLP